jgi:A/G-specific adenine glycosylase
MAKISRKTDELAGFRRELLGWFDACRRDLPWRQTRDPYAIWVSEIMLQQTRVAAVFPVYKRFMSRFPDFWELARAPEADVLRLWAGLGYYSRARNLKAAAVEMCKTGAFPATHEEIGALPGVGSYTAAAVASIAFGLPHAAVDGNVLRVLSRWSADGSDIGSPAGRRRFSELANNLLSRERPGAFNEALMELGATICLPRKPQCLLCPVASGCRARQLGRQSEFPVKLRRIKNIEEERKVFWIEDRERVLVWERPASSRLMAGFWELPERSQLADVEPGERLGMFRHGITVHNYRFEVFAAKAPADLGICQWVATAELGRLLASTILRKTERLVRKNLVLGPGRTAAVASK